MAWPTPAIRYLGTDVGGPANPDTMVVNFTAQPAGTLLLALYDGGRGLAYDTPSTGWSMLVDEKVGTNPTDPGFALFAKVADGTETSFHLTAGSLAIAGGYVVDVFAVDALPALSGFGNLLDQAPVESTNPSFAEPYTAADTTNVGSPNVRMDFIGGGQAVSGEAFPDDPAMYEILEGGHAGDANRGAAAVWAKLIDSTPGATNPGDTYEGVGPSVGVVFSILFLVAGQGWKIDQMGFA